MNHQSKPATYFSDKLKASIWWGWYDAMTGFPPRRNMVDAEPATASNYEVARQWAVAYKRKHGVRFWPIGELPSWLSDFIRTERQRDFAADLAPTACFVGHERFRPAHLVQADLANSLRAAGLESLQPPIEETY